MSGKDTTMSSPVSQDPATDGKPVTGVVPQTIHDMNAAHAKDHDAATKEETLDLLRRNSAAAAEAIRALTTRIWIGPRRCRCTQTRRSRASSCSRITPFGTAIITWRGFSARSAARPRVSLSKCYSQSRCR